jgi:hypothetical protein
VPEQRISASSGCARSVSAVGMARDNTG